MIRRFYFAADSRFLLLSNFSNSPKNIVVAVFFFRKEVNYYICNLLRIAFVENDFSTDKNKRFT